MSILVIGSGPAGASAAMALLEAGQAVTMLTAGHPAAPLPPHQGWWSARALDQDGWLILQGDDPTIWSALGNTSPKFRTPRAAALFAGYVEALGITTETFSVRGALAIGGLSEAWGAGVACFGYEDLANTVLSLESLTPYYHQLARHVGVCGARDDLCEFFGDIPGLQPPPRLSRATTIIEQAYRSNRSNFAAAGVTLGRARNAVITEPREGRAQCTECAMCLWGCRNGAIYAASQDIERLQHRQGFQLLSGLLATSMRRGKEGWLVQARDQVTGERSVHHARRVLLAAGAIASAGLVRESLGLQGVPGPLLSNPTSAFALWLPQLIGTAQAHSAFGLAQLSLVLTGPQGLADAAFINLFQLTGLPASELIGRLPFSLPTGRRLMRALMPGMLVGNLFLPGALSRHSLTLASNGTLELRGGYDPEVAIRLADARHRIGRTMRRVGAILLPGSFVAAEPGSDLHYAGTVPMRANPALGESDALGEVAGLPGVHVVDGAALPTLPAKPHTFTIMANARRIAKRLAFSM